MWHRLGGGAFPILNCIIRVNQDFCADSKAAPLSAALYWVCLPITDNCGRRTKSYIMRSIYWLISQPAAHPGNCSIHFALIVYYCISLDVFAAGAPKMRSGKRRSGNSGAITYWKPSKQKNILRYWGRFLLRQSDLTDLARCVCRSFITSERSTVPSLISDGTARTARIFVRGFSWTAWD